MSSTVELSNPERVNEEGTSMKIIHNPYVPRQRLGAMPRTTLERKPYPKTLGFATFTLWGHSQWLGCSWVITVIVRDIGYEWGTK